MQFGILCTLVPSLANDQALHRYCIPMDSSRPLLSKEIEFFNKGTGKGKSDYLVSKFSFFVANNQSFSLFEYNIVSNMMC